jgi:hypothetical protein
MAKMIPGGSTDQSAFFLSRNAAASDALVRLYVSLLARMNEKERDQEFKREMFDKGVDANVSMYDRKRADDAADRDQPDLGPDGARVTRGGAHADPPVATPPQRQPQPTGNMLPGVNAAPPVGKFTTSPPPPPPPPPGQQSALPDDDPMNAMAQASSSDQPKNIKPTFKTERSNTALPTVRNPRGQQAPASFVKGLDPRLIDAFEAEEQKRGLPRHTLMTLFGRENGGGRVAGRNGSAEGWFQFTDELAKQYNLSPEDRQNPYKMAAVAADNLVRNAQEYTRITGRKLTNAPEDIPKWGILHQFGHTDGPLLLHAAETNPGTPATAAMMRRQDPNTNYKILVNNGLDPTAKVGDLVGQQAGKFIPWTNASVQLAGDRPVRSSAPAQPEVPSSNAPTANNINEGNVPPFMQRQPTPAGKRSEVAGENAYAQGGSAGSEVPFGRGTTTQRSVVGDVNRTAGVNPRLVRAVLGGAELALPNGYTIHATSGVRHRGTGSYHDRRQAADFQIQRPDGSFIPNEGHDTTGLYTKLARGVKTWVAENDPGADKHIGYGGAFGSNIRTGGGGADLMHYDWGGSRGRLRPEVQFGRLRPLAEYERNKMPAQPRVQVASNSPDVPLPPAKPKEAKRDASGNLIVPTTKELYEPLKRPLLPTEQLPQKGQDPLYFAQSQQPASPSIADFNPLSTNADAFTPTDAAKVVPKVSSQGMDEAGMIANDPPSILARSGPSTPATEELPMPPQRPGEGGDLSDDAPTGIPLPLPPPKNPQPFGTDDGVPYDNSGEVYNAQPPDQRQSLYADLGDVTFTNKDVLPQDFSSPPLEPPSAAYVKPVDTPAEMAKPLPPLPANSFGERRAAALRSQQPQQYDVSREPPQVPDLGQAGIQRILPPEFTPPAQPSVDPGTAVAAISGANAVGNAILPRSPSLPDAKTLSDAMFSGKIPREVIEQASKDAVTSSKPTLEEIGNWIKDKYSRATTVDESAPSIKDILRKAGSYVPYPPQQSQIDAQEKIRAGIESLRNWYNSPSAPKVMPKPDVMKQQAPTAPPQVRMMPDGVTPYMPNTHSTHIKPPAKKGAGSILTDMSDVAQPNTTSVGKRVPMPGAQPQQGPKVLEGGVQMSVDPNTGMPMFTAPAGVEDQP